MRFTLALAIGTLVALEASGQRVVPFTKATGEQQLRDAATAVRSVGEIASISVNSTDHTITVAGSPAQLAFAEWALPLLDLDPHAQPVHGVVGDHLFGGDPEDAVRLFRTSPALGPDKFQELCTILRSVIQMSKYIYSDGAAHAVFVRGRRQDLQLGQWIVEQLDHDPAEMDHNWHEYTMPPPKPGADRVEELTLITTFRPMNVATAQEFQEMATVFGVSTGMRVMMMSNATRTMFVRSAPADAEVLRWVMKQLDQPGSGSPAEYHYPAVDDVIAVLYLPNARSPQEFQESASNIRRVANIRSLMTYSRTHAIVVRDNAEAVAKARQMVSDLVVSRK